MTHQKNKKIVFIIVEGQSDKIVLGSVFEKIFDKQNVFIHIEHGDITANSSVNSSNILSKICSSIKAYANNNHLTRKHFQEIIHIIDTDGAYIEDQDVQYQNTDKVQYTPTAIFTARVADIQKRNSLKRQNLNKIISTAKIWSLKYRVYYMSSNLEHVLHDKQNASDSEKISLAYSFAEQYVSDIPAFINYISNSGFSVLGDYPETWMYIQKDKHSLERHTNLRLCIPDDERA